MKRRAFSLLEIVMACSIVALLVGLSALQMRSGTRRASSHAVARLLQEECNSARQTAMGSGAPTAISLTKAPASRGIYLVQGTASGRAVRSLRYDGEYPRTAFTSASWDTAEWTWSSTPARTGGPGDEFDPARWVRPADCGATLIFLPGGQVTAVDWPRSPRGYHLVVGADLGVAGDKLQQANEPYTLTIDPLGATSVQAGVPSALLPGGSVCEVGIPQPVAAAANRDPAVRDEDVLVYPVPNLDTLPPGLSATLEKDTYLVLDLYASDPDGDPLQGRWEASGGVFTDAVLDQPLEYRRDLQKWKSTVAWAPPVEAVAGDIFFLKCTVEDDRGGKFVATKTVLGNLAAAVRSRGHLCTSDGRTVFLLDGDGTDLRELPLPLQVNQVSLDPTGRTLLMDANNKLYTMHTDGSDFEEVPGVTDACHGELSAYGQVVYSKTDPATGRMDLHRCALDGSEARQLTSTASSSSAIQARWSADGSRIVFTRLVGGNPGQPEVHLMDEEGESAGRNRAVGRGWSPCFDARGERIAFLKDDGLYTLRLGLPLQSPVRILQRSFSYSHSRQLSWSNWGNSLVFVDGTWAQPEYDASEGNLCLLPLNGNGQIKKALTGPIRSATWTW